jgi:hypothetical protein
MVGEIELGDDEVKFTVTYDGPEVARGRMDARDLAPAMLSMAKLVDHAASITYGTTAAIRVEVDADFRRGSFSYEIIAKAIELGNTLLQNLSISDLLAIVGLTGGGLIALVKGARGRRPVAVERRGENTTLVFRDGENITVNVNIAQLFLNRTVREDLDGVIAPLRKPGITEFRAGVDDTTAVTVGRDEIEYFEPPPSDDEKVWENETTELVEVLSVSFKASNKWRVALAGDTPFPALILDETFLERVRRHEVTFGNGDALKVRLYTRVVRSPTGEFKRYREIREVLDHLTPPPGQFDMFADSRPPDSPYLDDDETEV